ncbi:site-specific recombinase [Fusibacter sp. 3D3]|nr:site-specific recombinase [Fusibacter sp. 3D3]
MESGGELLITILSSQAQEESRNISENTRWGLTRRFENGIISVNHTKFLGYTKDDDGNLVIVPKELYHQVQVEKARRASLNKSAGTRKSNKSKKEKSEYSSKYVKSICGFI